MRWYDWYWTVALVLVLGVPETLGLATGHPEWTFSRFVWRVCQVTPGQALDKWSAPHVFLAFVMVWLLFHFALRWWH